MLSEVVIHREACYEQRSLLFRLSLPQEEGKENSICWQEMSRAMQWEKVFGNTLSGRKPVFIKLLVMNSGHLQMDGRNGNYKTALEALGQ